VRNGFSTECIAEKLLEIYQTAIAEFEINWPSQRIEERLRGIISDLARTLVRYKDVEAAKGHTELLLSYLQIERQNLGVREQNYLNQLSSLKNNESLLTQEVRTLQNKLEGTRQLWEQKNEAVQKVEELNLLLQQVSEGKIMKLLNKAGRLIPMPYLRKSNPNTRR
jgi:hypothetical protein